MSKTDDRNTLEGILAGDELIIKDFYKENLPYIRKYILQNSGNELDVEDVFQDALIIIYKKMSDNSLEVTASLRTYFYAICRNMWLSRLRKKKKLIIDDTIVQNINEIDDSIIQEIENKEQECLYRKYFHRLNDSCIEVLELFFAGKSMKEITSITGYTEGYTRKKKYDCKKLLIEKIENDPIFQELKNTQNS